MPGRPMQGPDQLFCVASRTALFGEHFCSACCVVRSLVVRTLITCIPTGLLQNLPCSLWLPIQ